MNFKKIQKHSFGVYVFIVATIMLYLLIGKLEKVKNGNFLQVNALPATNKVIVIDAGHGIPDEGASGFNKTTEQAINLSIALKLQRLFEQSGTKVILTRSDEKGVYSMDSKNLREKKVSDIKNRVDIANNSLGNLFISIHLNKYPPSQKYRGWQTFYQKSSEDSKKIALLVQENLNKNIEFKNDRVPLQLNNVYIMDKVKIPAIVVECGFLSNPEEAELLKLDIYQSKVAWGIFIGTQDYFNKELIR